MADRPASQDRQVTIGGQKFTFRFSLRAITALRDLWDLKNDAEVQARIASQSDPERLNMDLVVDIVWAAMRTHHPAMTREDVVGLLDDAGLEGVAEGLKDALSASTPNPEVMPRRPLGTAQSRKASGR